MTKQEADELVAAFRKAVDTEMRWGRREDVPAVPENWAKLVEALEKAFGCKKKTLTLKK
jgi:hypothetical protein